MTTAPARTTTVTAPALPKGDPDAIRGYAGALRGLARSLDDVRRSLAEPLPPSWRGEAARAAAATAKRLAGDLVVASQQLDSLADDLEKYAAALAKAAQHHHHWGRLLAEVGAVVVVTAAVVTITVATGGAGAAIVAGAAIDAEGAAAAGTGAAAAGAATAGTDAAATATSAATAMTEASSAAASAQSSLLATLSTRALPLLRQLSAFVRPQLVGSEVFTGADAALHAITTGHVSVLDMARDMAENVAVGGATGKVAVAAKGFALRAVGAGVVTGGAAAVNDATGTGHLSLGDIGTGFAEGAGASVLGDYAAAHDIDLSKVIQNARAQKLPELTFDRDAKLLRPATAGQVYRVDPDYLRVSQSSANNVELRRVAMSGGWRGGPVDAVALKGGELVSFDNRRVLVAREHGIAAQVRVHAPDEVAPDSAAARVGLKPGSTWGDVLTARMQRQNKKWRTFFGRTGAPGFPLNSVRPGAMTVTTGRTPRVVPLDATVPSQTVPGAVARLRTEAARRRMQ